LRQQINELRHGRALAHDVGKGVLLLKPFSQLLDLPEVLKGLHPSDDPALSIPKNSR
jgi:hypothetical protein